MCKIDKTKMGCRKCDECGNGMNDGYLDSGSYWCSEKCMLENNESLESWAKDCEENDDECYYTDWYHEDDEEYTHPILKKFKVTLSASYEMEVMGEDEEQAIENANTDFGEKILEQWGDVDWGFGDAQDVDALEMFDKYVEANKGFEDMNMGYDQWKADIYDNDEIIDKISIH